MRPEKLRALCRPDEPLEHTLSLISKALAAEPLLDLQLAELLQARSPNKALDQASVLRILEVLDRVSTGIGLVRAIGHLLGHANPVIRSKTAKLIGRRADNFDWIDGQLMGAETRVRANMLEGLWENRGPECLKAFALYRDDGNSRVAGNALYGLYLCGEADAIPSVIRMASHTDPKFRATAAWLMGKIGQPEFADPLKRMVKDDNRSVKGSALRSLVRINRAAGSAQAPDRSTAVGAAPAKQKSRALDTYFVTWQPEYSVSIDAIDRQHQALVALIRQLQEAMWEGRGRAFLETLIDRLVKYTNGHLRFEEDMLGKQGYDSLAEHIALHRTLTSQVCVLQHKIHNGEAVSNAAVLLFLRNWFTDHIMQHDQKYARALNSAASVGELAAPPRPEAV
ncbi:MAG: bacteriohemerythrin [Bryobacteraceae bacterium]|jgi:hemerythrin-like metal-binding protein